MRLALRTALLLALFAGCEVAPVPPPAPRSTSDALWNEAKDRPQLLGGPLFSSTLDKEATARAFLASRASEFHLDARGASLALSTTREGLAGTYLRFAQEQRVGDVTLPVFEGEVIVLVRDDGTRREVRAVNLELREEASTVVEQGDLGATAAIAYALASLDSARDERGSSEPTATRGIYVTKAGVPRLAWRVKVATEAPPHDWTLYVDAATGGELGRRDGVRFIDGTAYVFDMNPVASTGNTALVDGSDATTPALEAARFLVVLPRLDGTGNTSGTWADTRPRMAPRVNSTTSDFLFTRDNLGFEQANTYFHLDRAQARIQALGFTNVNDRQQEAIVDAQTSDNSFYSSNNLRLNFGRGGVDDAEDADIVLHEYGHSIQDNQVPNFGGADEGSMGEGFGDYLAASFSLALAPDAGHAQLSDPACVGDWDGTSYSTGMPKCLRRVDGTKHYPEAEENEVHADGEMWSAALWDLRGRLGADVMDKLVLEHHFLLAGNGVFFTAAQALITADLNLNGGVNGPLIRRRMIAYGLSRLLTPPAAPGALARVLVSIGPNRDGAGNYASNTDEVRTLTVPGATGLVLHFDRIELETHNSCFQLGCDNLYVTNGDGDLFSVFSGTQANVWSAAVTGDTVNIRLVSDPSQVRYGYHVDWIEVLGSGADAGVLFDGGSDLFDAGTPPPPFDAGVRDGGMRPDGGVVRPDGGVRDAGVADAGPPPSSDAGFSSSRTLVAYGNERLSPALNRGCGCGATSGLEAWGALALLGVLTRRRRQR
jgi:hypothetical protein